MHGRFIPDVSKHGALARNISHSRPWRSQRYRHQAGRAKRSRDDFGCFGFGPLVTMSEWEVRGLKGIEETKQVPPPEGSVSKRREIVRARPTVLAVPPGKRNGREHQDSASATPARQRDRQRPTPVEHRRAQAVRRPFGEKWDVSSIDPQGFFNGDSLRRGWRDSRSLRGRRSRPSRAWRRRQRIDRSSRRNRGHGCFD